MAMKRRPLFSAEDLHWFVNFCSWMNLFWLLCAPLATHWYLGKGVDGKDLGPCKSRGELSAPLFSLNASSAQLGDVVLFLCILPSNVSTTRYFICKDGHPVSSHRTVPHVNSYSLPLLHVSHQSEGQYACGYQYKDKRNQVITSALSIAHTLTVLSGELPAPEFFLNATSVQVGEWVWARCLLPSNVSATRFVFYKDGLPISSHNAKLQDVSFSWPLHISDQGAGQYACGYELMGGKNQEKKKSISLAWNLTISSGELPAPKFFLNATSVQVGEWVLARCMLPLSVSATRFIFYKDGLPLSSHKAKFHDDLFSLLLHISDQGAAGQYACGYEHMGGNTQEKKRSISLAWNLTVSSGDQSGSQERSSGNYPAPKLFLNATSVQVGEWVWARCLLPSRVSATKFIFYKDGLPISPQKAKLHDVSFSRPLHISDQSAAGQYACGYEYMGGSNQEKKRSISLAWNLTISSGRNDQSSGQDKSSGGKMALSIWILRSTAVFLLLVSTPIISYILEKWSYCSVCTGIFSTSPREE